MEFLWILGICTALITILLITYYHSGQSVLLLFLGFLIVVILCYAISLKLIRRWQKRRVTVCKACRKSWALECINRKIVNQEEIVLPVTLRGMGNDNVMRDREIQYIPAVRRTFEDMYKCKYCGNIAFRINVEEQKKI